MKHWPRSARLEHALQVSVEMLSVDLDARSAKCLAYQHHQSDDTVFAASSRLSRVVASAIAIWPPLADYVGALRYRGRRLSTPA